MTLASYSVIIQFICNTNITVFRFNRRGITLTLNSYLLFWNGLDRLYLLYSYTRIKTRFSSWIITSIRKLTFRRFVFLPIFSSGFSRYIKGLARATNESREQWIFSWRSISSERRTTYNRDLSVIVLGYLKIQIFVPRKTFDHQRNCSSNKKTKARGSIKIICLFLFFAFKSLRII